MNPTTLTARIIAIATATTLLACYVAHRQKQQAPAVAPGSKSMDHLLFPPAEQPKVRQIAPGSKSSGGPIFAPQPQTKARPFSPSSKWAPIEFAPLQKQMKASDLPVSPAPEQTATPQQ